MQTDIVVAGGGIAGMIAALVFAREGFRVVCVDAAPKPSQHSAQDLRSTAFLMPSIRLLEEANIFEGLASIAAPLRLMRIVDAGGPEPLARQVVDFDAQEAGEPQFGWNIPNAPLREQLTAQIEANRQIQMIFGDPVNRLTGRTTQALVSLASGQHIAAHLVVAADGRGSQLRDMAGIDVTTLRYGQKALVFQVSHSQPHHGVSTEVHRSGGPFTLVPLAGSDQTRSAVVWMTEGAEADRLINLPAALFEEAMNLRSCDVMGPLKRSGQTGMWPIISQFAERLTGQRLALIGEAAHVVPPIGAQGLNMSLADIAALRDLITNVSERRDIGEDDLLSRFQRQRWVDMRVRVQGIDALNRASMTGARPLQDIRASLLGALSKAPTVKRTAIRMGLGQ